MMSQVGEPAELVPFELLHLELVSHIIHGRQHFIGRVQLPILTELTRLSIKLVDSGPGEVGGEQDSAATSKLEALGYNAGFRLIERLAKDYPKFKDELDLLKFICKDFWVAVFRCSCFLGPP